MDAEAQLGTYDDEGKIRQRLNLVQRMFSSFIFSQRSAELLQAPSRSSPDQRVDTTTTLPLRSKTLLPAKLFVFMAKVVLNECVYQLVR